MPVINIILLGGLCICGYCIQRLYEKNRSILYELLMVTNCLKDINEDAINKSNLLKKLLILLDTFEEHDKRLNKIEKLLEKEKKCKK